MGTILQIIWEAKGFILFWGFIIGFVVMDNHFDCNGSDNWTPSKKNDWYADDYDNDGDTDYDDFEYWEENMTDKEKKSILYGDD
jgi:hypothetical protein